VCVLSDLPLQRATISRWHPVIGLDTHFLVNAGLKTLG
jgi:hypothetical protein